jgi:hypothetical protein
MTQALYAHMNKKKKRQLKDDRPLLAYCLSQVYQSTQWFPMILFWFFSLAMKDECP